MFSLIQKPLGTLNQTPKIDKTLPSNLQELKKQFIRRDMINTYISNQSYYNLTSA